MITLLLLPLFVYLGFWQLGRAEQKKQLITIYHLNQQQAPIDWDQGDNISQASNNTHLTLKRFNMTGEFLPNFQILLDNKTYQGQVGFQVYALFKPKHSAAYILVDRGFIPLNGESRKNFQSPKLNRTALNVKEDKISGTIIFPPSGIQLNQQDAMKRLDAEQLLIQQIQYDALSQYLNVELAQFVFKLDPQSPFILTFMPIHFGLSSTKHVGYALQWFMIAAAVLIYYFAINTRPL